MLIIKHLLSLKKKKVILYFKKSKIGFIQVNDCYIVNKEKDVLKVYNTNKTDHPGVKKELSRYKYRIGGKINILENSLIKKSLDPKKTKKSFLGKKDGKQLQVFKQEILFIKDMSIYKE